MMHIINLNNPN